MMTESCIFQISGLSGRCGLRNTIYSSVCAYQATLEKYTVRLNLFISIWKNIPFQSRLVFNYLQTQVRSENKRVKNTGEEPLIPIHLSLQVQR